MAVLYENDAFLVLSAFNQKTVFQSFEKSFRFLDNLFQSWSPENVQNFEWSSRKNMPISQTEGYFENAWYLFLEDAMLFLLAWKWNL